jgi:hypothetical protein
LPKRAEREFPFPVRSKYFFEKSIVRPLTFFSRLALSTKTVSTFARTAAATESKTAVLRLTKSWTKKGKMN